MSECHPDLEQLLEAVKAMPREWAPQILAAALARMMEVSATPPRPPEPQTRGDRWLTPEECANRLGWSRKRLYRRARSLPFLAREGRSLRFSERGLTRWMAQRLSDGDSP
jgi:hypothetical protein